MALAVLLAGCGGGHDADPADAAGQPTVTATSPAASDPPETGVDLRALVAVTFSSPMQPATISASTLSLACPAGVPVAASVAYDASTHIATLTPLAPLPPDTHCVATASAAVQDSGGSALAAAFVWGFVTRSDKAVHRP